MRVGTDSREEWEEMVSGCSESTVIEVERGASPRIVNTVIPPRSATAPSIDLQGRSLHPHVCESTAPLPPTITSLSCTSDGEKRKWRREIPVLGALSRLVSITQYRSSSTFLYSLIVSVNDSCLKSDVPSGQLNTIFLFFFFSASTVHRENARFVISSNAGSPSIVTTTAALLISCDVQSVNIAWERVR